MGCGSSSAFLSGPSKYQALEKYLGDLSNISMWMTETTEYLIRSFLVRKKKHSFGLIFSKHKPAFLSPPPWLKTLSGVPVAQEGRPNSSLSPASLWGLAPACSPASVPSTFSPATLASLRQPWFMLCTFLGWSSFISLIFALGLTSLLWSSPCTLGSQGTVNVSMEHLFQLHFCPLMSFFLWQDSPTSL